jgi:3-oxoacyl-[acyl-carrier-protein] synthase-3
MDGRAVFTFAATQVPKDVRQLLDGAGLTLDEVDRFVMHQGSRFIVKSIADRLKQPMDKFPVAIEYCGNTVSSTIPLILEKEQSDPTATTIVLSGFGVGLSWASCLCRRTGR